MVQAIRDFLTLFAPILAIGVFLNAVAPLRYKTQIQKFFENPRWDLSIAVRSFIESTFHRLFGREIFSKRFLLASVVCSLFGFLVFTTIFYLINRDPVCRYPFDWCDGLRTEFFREAGVLLVAILVIDLLSFAQTSLLIRYATTSSRAYELIFIAYADILLTLSIFVFVLPVFLTLNQRLVPESQKRTDIFVTASPKEDVAPEPVTPSDPADKSTNPGSPEDDELEEALRNLERDGDEEHLLAFAKASGAGLYQLHFYRRDRERPDRLSDSGSSIAVIRGTLQEMEGVLRLIAPKHGIKATIEEHRVRFQKDAVRVVRANLVFPQLPLAVTYTTLYTSALNINSAFFAFLRGYPLFVDVNREPLLRMVGYATSHYICVCDGEIVAAHDPSEFLKYQKFIVVQASAIARPIYSHILYEMSRHLVSLSVLFATTMFLTIVFYFSLLIFLVPACFFRSAFINILKRFGNVGKRNAISIAVALGALPMSLILVAVSRIF